MSNPVQSLRNAANQARERFLALQVRERWMLVVCVSVVVVTALFLGVWEPLVNGHAQRSAGLASARELAVKLEQAAQKVLAQRSSGAATAVNRNISLISAVDQASKQSSLGKSPSRIQPEGDKEVRVWFEDVSFDAVVRWAAQLQTRYGITVQTMDVESQSTAGQVNVRFSLVRGS